MMSSHHTVCLQKTGKFRTYPWLSDLTFALIIWENLWPSKKAQNIEIWWRLEEVLNKINSRRPSWKKYLKQGKDIIQNWAGAQNFDNCFCLTFNLC